MTGRNFGSCLPQVASQAGPHRGEPLTAPQGTLETVLCLRAVPTLGKG